jgi:hypothetical protein
MTGRRWLLIGTLLVALGATWFLAPEAAQACPGCASGLAEDDEAGRRVAAWFWSILFMMSMPFLLIGGFCGYMYLEVRRARARQQQDSPQRQPAAQPERSVVAGVRD